MRPALHNLILLWLMAIGNVGLQAQQPDTSGTEDKTRFTAGLHWHLGIVLIHSRSLSPLKGSKPIGLQTDLGWQFVNKKAWELCNCYPRTGVATTFWDWGNREILGYGVTAVAYVEPVFLTRHRLNISIRLGGGLSYLSNPYDSITNPENIAYSTRFNFPLMVAFGMNYRLGPHWNLKMTVGYNHVSNGGVHEPNKGINYPTASLGADYAFQGIDFKERAKVEDRSPPERRLRVYTGILYSFSTAGTSDSKQYNIFGGFAKGVYYVGRWSGLTLGAEWVADRSIRATLIRWGLEPKYHRGSVLIGHEFLLGHVVFSQQLGIYFYDHHRLNDPVYQRYGLGFKITEHLFAGFGVKAHRHVADFADLKAAWIF